MCASVTDVESLAISECPTLVSVSNSKALTMFVRCLAYDGVLSIKVKTDINLSTKRLKFTEPPNKLKDV